MGGKVGNENEWLTENHHTQFSRQVDPGMENRLDKGKVGWKVVTQKVILYNSPPPRHLADVRDWQWMIVVVVRVVHIPRVERLLYCCLLRWGLLRSGSTISSLIIFEFNVCSRNCL